jgi:hypothetical protein
MRGNKVLATMLRTIKWASIPILLITAVLSCFAKTYEPLMDFLICFAAIFFVERAVCLKQYYWAAGFAGIMILFSPLFLADKVFLLMGLTCIATSLTLFLAFRPQVTPAIE